MKSKSEGKDFCLFALPGMFCFAAVVILPFVYGVYLTLTDWDGVASVKNFIGLRNFTGVLKDGCNRFCHCLSSDKRDKRPEFFQGRILHP